VNITRFPSQTLLFDADDTLWENNIYFERAIAAFISSLDHHAHTPEQVRERLNACERATIAEHGYGLISFRRSLVDCFEQLSDAPVTPDKHAQIVAFTEAIATQEIELLPGVAETLAELEMRTSWNAPGYAVTSQPSRCWRRRTSLLTRSCWRGTGGMRRPRG